MNHSRHAEKGFRLGAFFFVNYSGPDLAQEDPAWQTILSADTILVEATKEFSIMDSNPVIDIQSKHVTIRAFTDEPIPEEMLDTILDAARRAPTSSNMQSYSVIVVKDPATKSQLADYAGGQKHVATCPVFLAFCADLHRLKQVCDLHELPMTNNLETFIISTVDAALVGMSVQTGAESCGLGAVMIGAMRNHPDQVARLLHLPKGVYVVFGMCLGWPVNEAIPPQKPRLPRAMVIHKEGYADRELGELIARHDQELAQYYKQQGRNLSEHAWSGVIARSLSRPLRPENLGILKDLGFYICGSHHD